MKMLILLQSLWVKQEFFIRIMKVSCVRIGKLLQKSPGKITREYLKARNEREQKEEGKRSKGEDHQEERKRKGLRRKKRRGRNRERGTRKKTESILVIVLSDTLGN